MRCHRSRISTATSLAGTYGSFSFNATTGAWGYALANGQANVQALKAGQIDVGEGDFQGLPGRQGLGRLAQLLAKGALDALAVALGGAIAGLDVGEFIGIVQAHFGFAGHCSGRNRQNQGQNSGL